MKKLLLGLSLIFICKIAIAHTLYWHVDNQILSTTTCSAGDTVIPPAAPAKYGYHLKAWAPSPYTPLEYIVSTGTQYIDTGVNLDFTKDFRIRGTVMNPSTNRRKIIIGNYTTENNMAFSIEFASNKQPGLTTNGIRVYFGFRDNEIYSASTNALPINTNIDIDFAYTASTKSFTLNCVANGQTYTLSDTVPEIPNVIANETLCLFLDKRKNKSPIGNSLIIESISFEQDTINKIFISSKDNLNAIGMFDTVSGTFFENAGTGEFIAGPEVQ